MTLHDRKWIGIIGLSFLIYIVLRFWKLTDSCLWFDEIFSLHAAEHGWNSIFWFLARDLIHPPLYYVLLKIWISIAGEGVFALRFLSVAFSVAALIPFYLFCRELKFKSSAIALAATFLAVNGALIKYSQEVRMYSLLFCLSLASIWLFARFFNSGRNLAALTVVNILLVYTHYFGWLVILSEAAAIIFLQKEKIRQILIMAASAFVGFMPWVFAVWQASKINADVAQNIGWMSRPSFRVILQFVFDVIEPFFFQQSSDEPTSIFLITVPLLLLITLAKFFYFADWKEMPGKSSFYLLLIFTAVPILAVFAASWLLPFSIWGSRHLIIVFAPILILAARFFTEIRIRSIKAIGLSLILVLIGIAFLIQLKSGQTKFIWCAWEDLARNVDAGRPQRIYVFEDLIAYHFWYAARASGENPQIFKVKNLEGVDEDTAYFLPREFEEIKTIDETGIEGERFWVAFRAAEWNEAAPPLRNFIRKGYRFSEPQVIEVKGLKAILAEAQK